MAFGLLLLSTVPNTSNRASMREPRADAHASSASALPAHQIPAKPKNPHAYQRIILLAFPALSRP
jgi:hypothetical protein